MIDGIRATEIGVFVVLATLIPQPALAYIDPGIGSLIFQGAIAAFVTVAAAWTGFKHKVLNLFGKNQDSTNSDKNASG